MSHTDIGSQLRGQVDQLGSEIWGGGWTKKARLRCWNKCKPNAVQGRGRTPRRTSSVSGKNVIKQSVRCELSNILRGNVFVEGLQLRLALIELLMVTLTNKNKPSSCSAHVQSERFTIQRQTVKTNHLFQSDACVALVHFHRELSPNSLNLEANKHNTTSEHPKRKQLKPRHKKIRGTFRPSQNSP